MDDASPRATTDRLVSSDASNANQGLSASRSIAAASRPKAWTISPSEERTFEAS